MALQASPDSFSLIPAAFMPPQAASQSKAPEIKNPENGTKKPESLTLHYAHIKAKLCADSNSSFSEGLATAYFRMQEEKGEEVFLQGDVFLSKLAKSVFEKNENLFIEACEKHANENYFLECAKALEEQGFVFEGNVLNKNSWLDLYKVVLRLTEEYLCTKGSLPSVKVSVNEENTSDLKIIFAPKGTGEKQLKEAALLPLKPVPCSSDFLCFGTKFFEFLNENFPSDAGFLEKIFDKRICKNLNPMPKPDYFATSIMEANKFGAYKDKKIYINHRLALDALQNEASAFLLLLTMLHEYGHLLDDILHERAGIPGDSEGEEGNAFAARFVERILSKSIKFADFTAPNPKGDEQKFDVEISNLSFEEKKGILCIYEFGEYLENGNLKLPGGKTIENAEFFGLANMPGPINKAYNAGHRTHQNLTATGAKAENVTCNQFLTDGSIWPDFPTTDYLNTNIPYALGVLASEKDFSKNKLAYESHFGINQHWHSMCPKATRIQTNDEVRNIILNQAEEWYSKAIKKKKEKKMEESLFALGKLCRMVQDSFVLSHSWRRYVGDENFIKESKIEKEDNGKIWTFQDYEFQDGNYHALADCPTQKFNIQTIGYKSAENATKEIMSRYARNLEWHERYSALYPLKNYLSNIYEICNSRKKLPSGGSHPWFKKENSFSREQVQDFLTRLSMEMEKY